MNVNITDVRENGTDKTLISSSGIENEGRRPEPEEMIAILEKCCEDLSQKALETGTVGDLTVVRSMVERLGEEGYVVIDQDNQVDMENAPVLEEFCEKVEQKQDGNVMFLMVLNNGGVVQFRMETEDGRVDVVAASLWWKEQVADDVGKNTDLSERHLEIIDTDRDLYEILYRTTHSTSVPYAPEEEGAYVPIPAAQRSPGRR